jgi:putative ABC transport system permease protein
MIKNYLKTAWRNLVKNKFYSVLNIAGLTTGITSCILIFLYVQFELSYDKYNKQSKNIYRLTELLHLPKEDRPQAVTSPIMAPIFQSKFPEIKKSVRFINSGRVLSVNQKKIYKTRMVYSDSSLFDVFTFPMLKGQPSSALINPYSIVLTEATAKKYFGEEEPLGKTMQVSDTINVTVTGIIKNVPDNSHLTFDCVLSASTLYELNNRQVDSNWFNNSVYSYLLLPENYTATQLESKINAFAHKEMEEEKKTSGLWYDFKLQPLESIHLRSHIGSEIRPNSDISYVYIFSAAAVLILIIACCNFINLATARSLNRSKEIGLRKVIGAKRIQLGFQFLGESFLFAVIAGILTLALVVTLLPHFNSFTGKSMPLNVFSNRSLLLIFSAIIICTGLIAGLYPALLMSSFAPINALRGAIRHGWQDIILRKGLVIFQFTIAIILIAGTGTVLQQLRYMQSRKLGLNKDQLVEIGIKYADLSKGQTLINELTKKTGVVNATLTDFSFKEGISNIAVLPEGASRNEITSQPVIAVDYDFLKTFQIPLVAGRDFSRSFSKDPDEAFIVNEAAVKTFGWKKPTDAIGKNMDWGLGKKGKVIGVVKDFNFKSLHDEIKPLVIHINPDWYRFVAIKIKPDGVSQTLKDIEKTWNGVASNSPFTYSFLDEDFGNLYKEEQNLQSVLTLFTVLSLFVACLGLFGLAAFTIKQRFKEIAVRKVLGGSVYGITTLLSKQFIQLVLISAAIAFPLSWWGMHKWLEAFAYRVNIGWQIFILAGVITLLIALLTVSVQAIKAAIANPVKSLRTE